MDLYVVTRSGAWQSEEELDASAACLPSLLDTFDGNIRFVRSYVMREDDGTFSAHCFFEATGIEWLERLVDASMLPADSIKPVYATAVA